MLQKDRKALGEYIRWVADRMELRDWEFKLEHEPAAEDCDAEIRITYGRKLALIYFNSGFREYDAARQAHTVAHEPVHCHLEPACNMVQNDLEKHLSRQADQLFWDAFKRQIEYGVDSLASAIAKSLPPIAWPK
jgi:hypothetical protein